MGWQDDFGGWLENDAGGKLVNLSTGGAAGLLFGESPADRQKKLQNNEFRDIDPGLRTGAGRSDQLGQRLMGPAPTAGIHQAGTSGFRGDQEALIRALQANTGQNGLAQQLVRQQVGQQVGSQNQIMASQMAGARGRGSLVAGAQGQRGMAQLGAAGANAAALGSTQASLGALGQLGGALQGFRGQDQNLALNNAQMRQQGGQFNVGSQLRQQDQAMEAFRQALAGRQAAQQAETQRYLGLISQAPAPNSTDQFLGISTGLAEAFLGGAGGGGKGKGSGGYSFGGTNAQDGNWNTPTP